MMKFKNLGRFAPVAVAGLMAAGGAHAAGEGPDVTQIVAAIAAAGVAAALVGNAKLVMAVGIKVWNWIKGAL